MESWQLFDSGTDARPRCKKPASAAVVLELGVDPRCLHRIEGRTVYERVAR